VRKNALKLRQKKPRREPRGTYMRRGSSQSNCDSADTETRFARKKNNDAPGKEVRRCGF
jgi:hypothetical protein